MDELPSENVCPRPSNVRSSRDRWRWLAALAFLFAAPPESPRLVIPDARDATIKTRRAFDTSGSTVITDILYLKGPWQRREEALLFPESTGDRTVRPFVTIVRCDERRNIQLNDSARTFAASPIVLRDNVRRNVLKSRSAPSSEGALVTITIDDVDTGERRPIGRQLARHVITTTKTDAPPGANQRSEVLVRDAWYIDVPPAQCIDWGENPPVFSASIVRAASSPDRVHVDHRGTAPRGLVIEEVTRTTSGDPRPAERVTLVEYSEITLDPSLFAPPEAYRPALPRFSGGFDLARTDTVANRLREYWDELASWAGTWRMR